MVEKLRRNLRNSVNRRLLFPLFRAPHPPEYTARGVFVGLLVGLTPTVGVQMPIVAGIWLLSRLIHSRLDFNLIVALAWTWVTNVFTAPFVYYAYIVTGRVLLGHWDDLRGYETFASRLSESLSVDAGWLEAVWVYIASMFQQFGVPLFVGSIPWTLLGAWLGYRWSLRLVQGFKRRREERRARRRARTEAAE